MEIRVTFPGGKRVDASFGEHVLHTDQPVEAGGEGTAGGPFDLFLASIGACAGVYVQGFCQARGIDTANIEIRQHVSFDPESHLPTSIDLELQLPESFPEKYRAAVQRAADHCKVKRSLAQPPEISVRLRSASAAA